MIDWSNIFILFLLILLSGIFSGSETALVSLHAAQVRNLVQTNRKRAKIVEKLKEKPQRLLITILIGNNVVNIGTSVFATVVATEAFGNHVIGWVTGILTILILVFGEIIPKTFSHKHAAEFSLFIAYPIYFLQEILLPLIWLLEKLILFINKILRIEHHPNQVVSEEDLRAMVNLSSEEGSIEASEAELIDNVIDFSTILVEEVMTPRSSICAVDDTKTVKETMELMVHQGLHSRLPVYHETLENPTGVVALREMAKLYFDPSQTNRTLADLKLMAPIVVPITQPIKLLFNEFRWKQRHLALVVDEHGSVVGLVTMEDILEEIMGEIRDETDSEEFTDIVKNGENSWSVSGRTELKNVRNQIGIWLGGTDEQESEDERKTLSLLLIENFQKIPKVGKSVIINNCELTVEKVENFSIKRVRLKAIS
jgi:putative hemolysin